ncbi:hypothetical protein ACFSHQ_18680 [Gemmobacter lanyuensis]
MPGSGASDQGDGDDPVAIDLEPCSVSQYAALEGLTGPQEFLAANRGCSSAAAIWWSRC